MRRLSLAIAVSLFASAAEAQTHSVDDGQADSQCTIAVHAHGENAWLINSGAASGLAITGLNSSNMLPFMDQVFQNLARQSRAESRQYVINNTVNTCSKNDSSQTGCVVVGRDFTSCADELCDHEDPGCMSRGSRGSCENTLNCNFFGGEFCGSDNICTSNCSHDADCREHEVCAFDPNLGGGATACLSEVHACTADADCTCHDNPLKCADAPPGVPCCPSVCQANGVCSGASTRVIGYSTVGLPRPNLTMCAQMSDNDFNKSVLDVMAAHELGHACGLDHPDDTARFNESLTCGHAATDPNSCLSSDDTDGCGGELMCALNGCAMSEIPQHGDARGLRNAFNNIWENKDTVQSRLVFTGIVPDATALAAPTVAALGTFESGYQPRIDCVRGTSSVNAQCVATITEMTDATHVRTRVLKLSGFNATTGAFTTRTPATTITAVSPNMAPDIAIDSNASFAFVTIAERANINRVWLFKVDLSNGTTVGTRVFDRSGAETHAALPPRVVFSPEFGLPIVFSYSSTRDATSKNATRSTLNIKSVDVTNRIQSSLNVGRLVSASEFRNNEIPTDFDVDCGRYSILGVPPIPQDKCTIVALRRVTTDTSIGKVYSLNFTFQSGTIPAVDANWSLNTAIPNQTSVQGVAKANSSSFNFLVSLGLSVSSSRWISDSAPNNTVSSSYIGMNVGSSNQMSVLGETADAQSCRTDVVDGWTFPPATLSGGFSESFCGVCGSGNGLVTIQWGHRDANDTPVDFCF